MFGTEVFEVLAGSPVAIATGFALVIGLFSWIFAIWIGDEE